MFWSLTPKGSIQGYLCNCPQSNPPYMLGHEVSLLGGLNIVPKSTYSSNSARPCMEDQDNRVSQILPGV